MNNRRSGSPEQEAKLKIAEPKARTGVAFEAADVSVADKLTSTVDGKDFVIDRAKIAARAELIIGSPDGAGDGGLFAFLAGLPGSGLRPAQEIGPKGPRPDPDTELEA